jgi:hypothetical protein
VGAAQPSAATACRPDICADPDEHPAAAPSTTTGGDDDHITAAVSAAAAALPAAGTVLPAQRKPDRTSPAATATGARSAADFVATGQLTSPASEIHRYTGVP